MLGLDRVTARISIIDGSWLGLEQQLGLGLVLQLCLSQLLGLGRARISVKVKTVL